MVDIHNGQATIRGATTETVQTVITGDGSPVHPYVVRMNAFIGIRRPIVMRYLTAGSYTWKKPSFGSFVTAYVCGAGGGGGGGYRVDGNVGPLWRFGVGGRGGVLAAVDIAMTDLPSSIPVSVGSGGIGGTSIVGTGGPGNSGVAGGPSSFDGVFAPGGIGGASISMGSGTDPRVAAVAGQGGSGGLYSALSSTITNGLPGGAGYPGQTPSGGDGGKLGPAGDGLPGPSFSRYRGTGGGGGGNGDGGTVTGAWPAGNGGPGAGGGGAGSGGGYDYQGGLGAGGRGGDGFVTVLIQ